MNNIIYVRDMHEHYEQMPQEDQRVINKAHDAVKKVFADHGWPVRGDDRAEELIAALTHYKIVCEQEP